MIRKEYSEEFTCDIRIEEWIQRFKKVVHQR